MSIRDYLSQTAANWRKLGAAPGAWLTEEFLAQKGTECHAQPLPRDYPKMVPRLCFGNAYFLARTRKTDNLRYCEGYAMAKSFSVPILHAWAVNADNYVIDPTLDDPEQYEFIGFPMSLDTRKQWLTRGSHSVFDTGRGINLEFILHECSTLLDLMEPLHRDYAIRKLANKRADKRIGHAKKND